MISTATKDSPARSQAERAYWLLAERIIRLELPPGSVLLDRDIMAETGIGRTPIREAMQRLATEGLTVHYPHRGVVVSEISASSTRSIYEFRALIDGEAIIWASAVSRALWGHGTLIIRKAVHSCLILLPCVGES